MKSIALLIVIFLCGRSGRAQFFSSPPQLNFESYFQGKPDKYSPFVALTVFTWKYSYQIKRVGNQLMATFEHENKIEKKLSWVKLDRLSTPELKARVLHHEQGHVDISFIMVSEADRVLSSRTYSKNKYKAEIEMLAVSVSNYFDTMQRNYDEETAHGSNYKMQQRWDNIIAQKMGEIMAQKD
ncbi:putative secreted Zn-dependent protease [Pedobacter sp. UYEF25]